MNTFQYKAYGTIIESELEIPELLTDINNKPNVTIKYGRIPENLPRIRNIGVMFQAYPNDFLLRVENLGAYRVQNGNNITIAPLNNIEIKDFRLFLLGSVFGALLHQKGVLPLHGSAVLTKYGAIIIAGDSAVGKSSLAAGLAKKGYPVISDDISAIDIDSSGVPIVQPGIPYLKLWKDVLNYFNDNSKKQRVRSKLEKYKHPLGNFFSNEPAKIHKLVFLAIKNSPNFKSEKISGAQKFDFLRSVVYRSKFIDGLGLQESSFRKLSKLAELTMALEVQRPAKPLLINELVEFFENEIINF